MFALIFISVQIAEENKQGTRDDLDGFTGRIDYPTTMALLRGERDNELECLREPVRDPEDITASKHLNPYW